MIFVWPHHGPLWYIKHNIFILTSPSITVLYTRTNRGQRQEEGLASGAAKQHQYWMTCLETQALIYYKLFSQKRSGWCTLILQFFKGSYCLKQDWKRLLILSLHWPRKGIHGISWRFFGMLRDSIHLWILRAFKRILGENLGIPWFYGIPRGLSYLWGKATFKKENEKKSKTIRPRK